MKNGECSMGWTLVVVGDVFCTDETRYDDDTRCGTYIFWRTTQHPKVLSKPLQLTENKNE